MTKLAKAYEEGFEMGIQMAANCIPTSWLDPILSGPDKALQGVNDCQDIERLLRTIQDNIRSLKPLPRTEGK